MCDTCFAIQECHGICLRYSRYSNLYTKRFFDMVMVFILYSLCLCIFSIYLNKIIFGGFL